MFRRVTKLRKLRNEIKWFEPWNRTKLHGLKKKRNKKELSSVVWKNSVVWISSASRDKLDNFGFDVFLGQTRKGFRSL